MERATTYEAISAPSALGASLIAFATAALTWSAPPAIFLAAWMMAVAASNGLNAFFIARASRARGEMFFSPGMRHTLRAVSPALVSGAVVGAALILSTGQSLLASSLWITFYGLALLAMQGFAPKPIFALGITFTMAGIVLTFFVISLPSALPPLLTNPSLLMACTFGLFHLGYAICVPMIKRTDE